MIVLALNAGSTSLKFGLFRVDEASCKPLSGDEIEGGDVGRAVQGIPARLAGFPAPDVVGHRIVHGGPRVRRHALIDAAVARDLQAAATLAPLHAPPALAALSFAQTHFPGVPQVACLDCAFHADMPEAALTLPLPVTLRSEGLRRYGFHGLSCQSILRQLGAAVPERLVIAHLGGGCSVTAVRSGRSIDTSMGLTPSGGLMMATRAGDLDPGVMTWLMREKGMGVDALEGMLDRQGGLLGVSGLSGDMRALRLSKEAGAKLAIEMFVQSVSRFIAGMMAGLGGADLLVFTGGIGEHDAATREAACERLAWAGVGSSCAVAALPSLEDEEIARISAPFGAA